MIYDADRARLRGTLEHLGVLGQVLAGHDVEAELRGHLADLRHAGAVRGTDVAPDLQELVATVSGPQFALEIETSSPAGAVHHSISVLERTAWVMEGWGDTEEVTWWPLEPALIIPAVASLVGLRRRDAGTEGRAEVKAPLELVERALEVLRRGGPDHRETALAAARAVVDQELSPPAARALMAMLVAHRSAWRVTVVDGTHGEPQARGMAVVDAGPSGLWLRTAPAEPMLLESLRDDTELVLSPTTPGQVWAALVGLLEPTSTPAAA